MNEVNTNDEAKNKEQIVFFVHGTFAASNEYKGSSWWQEGSSFDKFILRNLSKHVPDKIVTERLQWSGLNSEQNRLYAAQKLLDTLHDYEHFKTPYHLIGHSHGGSLIWEALKLNESTNVSLKYLKSWSTVGTPFLQKKFDTNNIARSFFMFPAIFVGVLLILSALFLVFMQLDTGNIKLEAITFIVSFFTFPVLFPLAFSNYFENFRDKKSEITATQNHYLSWLGVYSKDDEAINALKVASKFDIDLIPRKKQQIRLPFKNHLSHRLLSEISSYCIIPLYWLFNNMVAPISDKFISSQIKQGAFGDNCPGMTIQGVSNNPTHHIEQSFPLSDETSLELKNGADEHIKALAPHLRTALTKSAMEFSDLSNILNTSVRITGKELIHTSYFLNENICNLLIMHMVNKINGNNISSSKNNTKWLNDFYTFSKDRYKEVDRKADWLLKTLDNRKSKERLAQIIGFVLGGLVFVVVLYELLLMGN